MQERDEDLAWSYERIHKLEKRILKMTIAVIILGLAFAVTLILLLRR